MFERLRRQRGHSILSAVPIRHAIAGAARADRQEVLRRATRRVCLAEPLERRRLLAIDAAIALDNVGTPTLFIFDDLGLIGGANQIQDNQATISRSGNLVRVSDPLGVFTDGTASASGPGFADFDVANFDAVHVDLQGGNDDLTFDESFTSGGINTIGLVGDGGEGDVLFLEATTGVAQTVTIDPDNTDGNETDIANYAAVTLNASGFEQIVYLGEDSDDTLIVTPGPVGTARVQNSPTDQRGRVTSDTLPIV